MTRQRIIATTLVALGVLAVFAVVRAGGDGHVLRATFSSAVNVVPGAEVRAGGVRVGKVRSINVRGQAAELDLGIDDTRLWPLREGTRARIRLGGTISYANRYVELLPGPRSARALPDRAELPAADTTSPFEFDQVFNMFDPRTRAGLGALIDRGAVTLGPRGAALHRGLAAFGPSFHEIGVTLSAIGADRHALRTLVRAGAQTAGALARRDAQLHDLVDAGATTLTSMADNGDHVRRTLARLPLALRTARGTFGRLDRSLVGVDALIGDIAPGARQLRRSAAPVHDTVSALRAVAPALEATLARVQRSGPTIARFLDEAVPTVRRLRPTLSRLAPMAACLRAYSPEIAAFFSTWASLGTEYDQSGRWAQVNGQAFPFPNTTPASSASMARMFPQLRYALLRPPGLNAGEPSMLAACGATQDLLDPAKDPEARG